MAPLQCFCDNLGLITTITDMLKKNMACPNDATNHDHDIYLATLAAVKGCNPATTAKLPSCKRSPRHRDLIWQLTVTEILNIDCNS